MIANRYTATVREAGALHPVSQWSAWQRLQPEACRSPRSERRGIINKSDDITGRTARTNRHRPQV